MASSLPYHRSMVYPPSRAMLAAPPAQAVVSDLPARSVSDGIAQEDVKNRDVYQAYNAHHRQQYQEPAFETAPLTTAIPTRPVSNHNLSDVAMETRHLATRDLTSSERSPDGRYSTFSSGIEFSFDDTLDPTRSPNGLSSDSNNVLTPAQRRRKAQNRAAQRALRDRKRQRVQILEEQVTNLSIKSSALETQNSWLKDQLLLYSTDGRVARMSHSQDHHGSGFLPGPQDYSFPGDHPQACQVTKLGDMYMCPVHDPASAGPAHHLEVCAFGAAASWPPMSWNQYADVAEQD